MSVSSMTGFASVDGAGETERWHWEIRSVNGRGLDLRMRLPAGFERLEPVVRERTKARIDRGSLSVSLSVQRLASAAGVRVNEAVLTALLAACDTMTASARVAPPRADGLLALRGVLESDDDLADEQTRLDLDSRLIAGLDEALDELVRMRRAEGAQLAAILESRLARIADLVTEAEQVPSLRPEAIAARLAQQVAQLVEAAPALDPGRLHQEAVLLATKADIREELDRLAAHIAAARDLIATGGPIGRKLEFLTQEFNREANTLCSKSNDVALTRIGLELKSVVDQLREQVQNVE
jgi:uncharacterized protein (TIGR00255 family)